MAKINSDKKQIEYWQARNERTFLEGEKDILDYAESLKKQYTNAANKIEEEIQKFYGKFAVDNNYTMADLKKLLNRDELKSFKESIKDIADYAKEHKLDKDFETQIKLLRAKSKISRLDELKTKINFEVEKLYSDVDDSLGEQLQKSFEDGYYKTIFNQQKFLGFSDNFAMLNQKAIQKAVTTSYMTENYSDVLWKNKTNLMNILNQQIPQGIILGYNPNKTAKIASQQLGSKYKSTARLIRTEYNLILNDATAQGYKEANIEKYQILATLDSRTSDICRDMDGEIFKVKEKEVGVNYPPFHPNCRTTTIPYFEPDEFDTEIEQYIKDENGIKHKITDDTQYEEWKNALKKNKDGTAIYENEAANYEFKNAQSLDEVKQRLINNIGAKSVRLNNMDLRVANGYLEGAEEYLQQYPELKNFVTDISTGVISPRTLADCGPENYYYPKTDTTKFANKVMLHLRNPKDVKKYYDTIEYNVKEKFHYEGFSQKTLVMHELTHALEDYIYYSEKGFYKDGNFIAESHGHQFNNGIVAKQIIEQARQELYGKQVGKEVYDGMSFLGRYAFTNYREELAQAISYEMGVKSTPFTSKVKELLDKRLREVRIK